MLSTNLSQAQQTPIGPDSVTRPATRPAAGAAVGAGPDVILLIDGNELVGRVLRITPQSVRYLPLSPLTDSLAKRSFTPTDTLQLAATDVFLIRYANGTKEVVQQPTPVAAAPSLDGLSAAQRYERGRQDSRQYYKPAPGVFWGTLAGSLGAGIGLVGVGTGIALATPPRANLNAPAPALLNDPAYYKGYIRQANKRKLGKVAVGFVLGVPVAAGVGMLLFSSGLLGTIK
ncbi:hypothetical protein [Hymenobacter psychrophilus]|nr:hypothetical protein [Hymenobacter psychrophilus]